MTLESGSGTLRPREEIQEFAKDMQWKLMWNDHKGGWAHIGISELIDRIAGELEELRAAYINDADNHELIRECADIANYCMMLADNLRLDR